MNNQIQGFVRWLRRVVGWTGWLSTTADCPKQVNRRQLYSK